MSTRKTDCPNCGQTADSGFHACWNLKDCPYWVDGKGWVFWSDLTDDDKKVMGTKWPDGPFARYAVEDAS